jgi:FkbM family methyltransferase
MSGPGLSSNEEIVWEYIDQHESEFLYHEIFINHAYFHDYITLHEGDLIIDAGANIGLFSLYCLTLQTNLRIGAIEPIQPIYDVLKRNLTTYFLNERKSNLKLFNLALGSRNESQQPFYYFPSAPGESTRHLQERNHQKYRIQQLIRTSPDPFVQEIFPQQSSPPPSSEITNKRKICEMEPPMSGTRAYGAETCFCDVVTLPNVMREAYGEDWVIDLLKIDVEGDEWNILLGLGSSSSSSFSCSASATSSISSDEEEEGKDRERKEDEVEVEEEKKKEKDERRQIIPLHRIRQIVLEVHDQPLDTQSILTKKSGRLDHIVEFLQHHGFTVVVEQQTSKVCHPLSESLRHDLTSPLL